MRELNNEVITEINNDDDNKNNSNIDKNYDDNMVIDNANANDNDENNNKDIYMESNLRSSLPIKSLSELSISINDVKNDNNDNNHEYISPVDINDEKVHNDSISKINDSEKCTINDIEKNENENEKNYGNDKIIMKSYVQTYIPYLFCLYVGIFDGALLVPFKFSTKNNNDLLNVLRYLSSFGIFSIIVSPIFFMIYCIMKNTNDPDVNTTDPKDYKIPPFHVKAALLPGICQGMHIYVFIDCLCRIQISVCFTYMHIDDRFCNTPFCNLIKQTSS
jgi:hypothetical protein